MNATTYTPTRICGRKSEAHDTMTGANLWVMSQTDNWAWYVKVTTRIDPSPDRIVVESPSCEMPEEIKAEFEEELARAVKAGEIFASFIGRIGR